jgi:hypothetical protein
MTTWVLVLWIHAGAMSNSDSMALTNVPGFKSEASCQNAGHAATAMTSGTVKAAKFVCLKQE